MLYLVDGYNMIGAWPEFRGLTDISQSRELLISMLADFAGFTGDELMLVFDGYKGDKPKTSVERVAGIDVIFTKRSETADRFIERTVDERMANLPRFSRQATTGRRRPIRSRPSRTACRRTCAAAWRRCGARPGTSKGCHWAAKGGKAECRKASRRNDMRK